jgi:hypothetical protein
MRGWPEPYASWSLWSGPPRDGGDEQGPAGPRPARRHRAEGTSARAPRSLPSLDLIRRDRLMCGPLRVDGGLAMGLRFSGARLIASAPRAAGLTLLSQGMAPPVNAARGYARNPMTGWKTSVARDVRCPAGMKTCWNTAAMATPVALGLMFAPRLAASSILRSAARGAAVSPAGSKNDARATHGRLHCGRRACCVATLTAPEAASRTIKSAA